ncbi:UDP-2,3-diacylglucosamine diphosphatase [Halioxenophilus sp. WMMB6]|uniref:UDP-2,3-diacylglucosamine diphosphatase n=1 Tax=Halioxenophilus sp. WMMB6 TaxID=3073815 RepID=UPI00295F57FD|nr:UDP-2,3-diacylglucosamine diphosphatase [Halioxenophilus sp. WMMB6]
MSTLFISDLHLDESRPQITKAFLRFLFNQASKADALYILGDLFEAWIGDDDDSEFVLHIKEAINRYAAAGVPTYFLHGNRDFLIGERFAEETGITLLNESTVVNLYDTPVLLMHGDTLCTTDSEYLEFRAQVRSPAWQAQVLSQPLAVRREMAKQLRAQSKSMNAMKAEDIMDVTPSEVVAQMQAEHVTKLIHGHTHRPNRHIVDLGTSQGERIVLGDWGDQGWYLNVEPDQWSLVNFPIPPAK